MSKLSELLSDQTSVPQGPPDAGLKDVLGKVWDVMAPAGAHGAHELASALFRGDGFVLYQHQQNTNEQDQGHGLPQEASKQVEMDGPSL